VGTSWGTEDVVWIFAGNRAIDRWWSLVLRPVLEIELVKELLISVLGTWLGELSFKSLLFSHFAGVTSLKSVLFMYFTCWLLHKVSILDDTWTLWNVSRCSWWKSRLLNILHLHLVGFLSLSLCHNLLHLLVLRHLLKVLVLHLFLSDSLLLSQNFLFLVLRRHMRLRNVSFHLVTLFHIYLLWNWVSHQLAISVFPFTINIFWSKDVSLFLRHSGVVAHLEDIV